ncbi:MAG: 30S ribosomal protein S6 [Candidatus Shikimatogenerans sp. Tcar]|uniref:Small ribosomal subunit protein bS6 n=1 Tax=Candidatus Shikimatogenerans sp. Tcar TaxID=3158565 RepID=A0AAU7QRW2_9FLAO
MKLYEIILIINPFLKENKIFKIINLLEKYILHKKGLILYKNFWGLKKFQYDIKKNKNGYYFLIEIKIFPKYIINIKENIKNEENILRYLIIKLNKYAIKYLHNKRNINKY